MFMYSVFLCGFNNLRYIKGLIPVDVSIWKYLEKCLVMPNNMWFLIFFFFCIQTIETLHWVSISNTDENSDTLYAAMNI